MANNEQYLLQTDEENKYYEISEYSLSQSTNSKSSNEESWAKFSLSDDRNSANLEIMLSNYVYKIVLYGSVEAIQGGYAGLYQGYLKPQEEDAIMKKLLLQEEQVIVSVNVACYNKDVFFTVVIGVMSDENPPIVKAYGVRSGKIDEILNFCSQKATETFAYFENSDSRANSVDAAIVFQTKKDIKNSSGLALGQISMYHTEELENQNATPVRMKVNTNNTNTNTYLRSYYSIPSSYYTSTLPVKIMMSMNSLHSYLTVSNGSQLPEAGEKTYKIGLPYLVDGEVNMLEVTYRLSSTSVSLSNLSSNGLYKKIQWIMSHTIGMGGTNGDYTSTNGQVALVEYRYDGNVTSNASASIQSSAYIVYTMYVENPSAGTTTSYSFTTPTTSVISNMTILP